MIKKSLIVLIFLFLISGFFHPIASINQDLGRHLLIGEIIARSLEVPKTNLFSYTYPGFPFINHHWLSEVFYFFITKLFGFDGLLIISVLLVVLSFLLVFIYSYRRFAFLPLIVVSFLSIKILFERTDVRPEVFSFLFVSLFITILFRFKEKATRLVFLLPLIELMWVNIHIYFIIGIAILGLFFVDELIAKRKELLRAIKTKQIPSGTKWLFIVLILTIFSSLLNPNTLQGALYPFRVFNNYGYTIEENQTIFFLWNYSRKEAIIYFAISFILLFLSLLVTIKKTRPVDWMLTLFFGFLATQAIRNFPLFVFATFIPFVRSLSIIFHSVKVRPSLSPRPELLGVNSRSELEPKGSDLVKKWVMAVLLIVVLWQIQTVLTTRPVGIGVEKGAKDALDFYEKTNLKGPIFNNFDNGSYIAYRLYPKERVFVDGRPEAYPEEFFREIYKSMQLNHDVFKTHEKRFGFNTIIFAHTDQTEWGILFLRNILNDPTWSIVFLDNSTIILAKKNKQNEQIIKNFALNETSYRINFDTLSSQELFRLTGFFQKAGWQKKEKVSFQEILSRDPSSCMALFQLARITLQANDPSSSVYINKYNVLCK